MRNITPDRKLALPRTIMKIRKPVGPSERWGVSTAEKIVGSWAGSLSGAMAVNIGGHGAENTSEKNGLPQGGAQGPEDGACWQGGSSQGPSQAGGGRSQGLIWRDPALDAGRGRGGVPQAQGRDAGSGNRARARGSLPAPGRGGVVGAGDRCRRQQGDAGPVRGRAHTRQDGGARRSQGARLHQD